jgi:hypothetical protein
MDSPVDQMRKGWEAYNGCFPASLERTKDKAGRAIGPDFNVVSNRCRPIVNAGRAFLFGKEVTFSVEEGVGQQAQDDLNLVWKANRKGTRLRMLATNGAVTGHAFIKIIPDGIMYQGQTLPRIVVLDSQQVSVETADEDVDRVLAYNVTWQATDAAGNAIKKRQRFERIDEIDELEPLGAPEQWQIRNQTRKTNMQISNPDQGWVDDEPPQAWEYPWSPILGCQNLVNPCEYWGMPDLTPDIIALNENLNLVRSSDNKIVYHFGFPHRYGVGFEAANLQFTPDGMPILPSKDSEIRVLDVHADLTAARAHADDLGEDIDEISATPGIAMGRMADLGGGDIPAATMRLKFQPLLSKTDDKHETYGDLLGEVNAHILELLNYGPDIEVKNVWPKDVLPRNEKEYAEAATAWDQLGVSKDSLMEQYSDFDPDTEAKKKADEQKAEQDIAQQALANYDAGQPNANPFGAQDGSQDGQQPNQPPAGNVNHPAMQAQRAAAIAAAGGQ